MTEPHRRRGATRPSGHLTRRGVVLGGAATAAVSATGIGRALAQTAAPQAGSGTATSGSAAPTATSPDSIIETRVAPTWVGPSEAGSAAVLGEQGLEPFPMLGVSVPGLAAGAPVEVRVLGADGWGPWTDVHGGHGADSSDLCWVGPSTGYQVRGTTGGPVRVHLARDRSGLPRRSGAELLEQRGKGPSALNGLTPPIILRQAWAARPPTFVEYHDTIRVGIVHHTVSSNTYAPQDVPGILRSIQAYHMDVNGWWDIAYQFLIDIYGNIWEGRAGGIDESFFGAHSQGFNTNSFGVANMGDFTNVRPSSAMLDANAELLAWKLKRYDIDAAGTTTIETTGEGNEWYRPGQIAVFPAIIGHRDTRPTGCPGNSFYPWLPWLRTEAHNRQSKYSAKLRPTALAATGPLARNSDGRLEVFGVGVGGTLEHIWQWPSPSGWSELSTLNGSFPAKPVSAISNQDGRLEVFLAGHDGKTYHLWQSTSSPNGWSDFSAISGLPGSAPSVGRNADGRLEVFAVSDAGELWHAWQVAPNSGWSDVAILGTGFAGSVGLGTTDDGKLVVYGVTAGGTLQATVQNQPNSWFIPWVTIGSGTGGRPAAGRNADGRLEVFVLGTDQRLWHSWQSGWVMSALSPLGNQTFSQPPAVTRNQDGRMEVFAVGTDSHLWHTYQLAPNAGWSAWEQMGPNTYAGPPAVIANADGRLEVFLLGTDHAIWHAWQVAPNTYWSTFIPLTSGIAA